MTLDECYNHYKGVSVNVDGNPADTGQCVQWADVVLAEVYGMVTHYGNAIDWWNDPGELLSEGFERVTDGSIKYGDFVVFNTLVGSKYGHIDVAMEDASTTNFLGSDSNWGGNLTVHLVRHSNPTFVLGSLRLKGEIMDKITGDQENSLAVMATGSYPGKDYNYQFTGKPLTQDNLDKMLQFWQGQVNHPPASDAEKKLAEIKAIVG